MIDHRTFYERIEQFCKTCEFWTGKVCRKGHTLSSSTGCPIKKFPPINAAGYDEDREPEPLSTMNGCCGQSDEMPDISQLQVVANFAQAMVRWTRAGLPLVSQNVHNQRHGQCQVCPYRQGSWCQKCKCLTYLKTKIATEGCPDNPPRWRPLG